MYLRGQMFVFTPRNGVQVCGCVHKDELLLQTFKEPTTDDADQSPHAHVANEDAYDGIQTNANGLLVSEIPRLETTTSLNKL